MIITVIGIFELPTFALSVEDVSNAESERMTAKYKSSDESTEEEKYNNYKPAYQSKNNPQTANAEDEDEKDLKAVTIASGKIESKKSEEVKEEKPLPAVVETPAVKTPTLPERVPVVAETAVKEEVTDDMRQASGLTLVETVPDRSDSGFIKNPLPGPKPHVARELTYDYDFKDEDLDFDITDLKGKDYYDI